MVIRQGSKAHHLLRILTFLPVLGVLYLTAGCATDVIPTAPTPKSRKIPIERNVPRDQLLSDYDKDFQETYKRDAPWNTHLLVYLSVRFIARDGLERFEELSQQEQDKYPGIRRFVKEVEAYDGEPWSYAAYLALETLNQPRVRESFRSDINFKPFQNFAVGKWLKTRLESDRPLPDFNAQAVKPEVRQPILKATALILTAQYYLESYQSVTEPSVLDEHYQADIQWLLKQWSQNYLRVRTLWPQRYDLTVLSSETLAPLYEAAGDDSIGMPGRVNPTDRRFGRSTLPFRDIYDVAMENIPPRVRDLQTKAIEEYIAGRMHSSLRLWLQSLTYAMKFALVQEFTEKWSEPEPSIEFYARNSLEDIKNVIQIY